MLLLSHLLFQLFELLVRGSLARSLVEIRLQQLILDIHARPRAARRLQVAPRALGAALGLSQGPVTFRGVQLVLHLAQLFLRERLFIALGLELALQHRHALAVLARVPVRSLYGLLLPDLSEQSPSQSGVASPLSLSRGLVLCPHPRFAP